MALIAFVEDNEAIAEAVAGYLELSDHVVRRFTTSDGVVEMVVREHPALVILDVMLPGESGFALARRIRRDSTVPFIFLTARESEGDRILGLELGAEDYVVKPFSPRELVLRVDGVLRRTMDTDRSTQPEEQDALRSYTRGSDRMTIDRRAHTCSVNDSSVSLTASEWRVLTYLANRPGRVVPRETILTAALDYAHEGSERTVDTHVKNLRAKIGNDWVETIRAFGYRFPASAEEET